MIESAFTMTGVDFMKKLDVAKLEKNIHAAAEYDFTRGKVFGSAYCVLQDDEVVLSRYYGVTDMDSRMPVTDQTIFRLASMTKPVTAFAVLCLIDRGLLSLQDPVFQYLPEFKDIPICSLTNSGEIVVQGRPRNPVTILHLLNHTSGFGSDIGKMEKLTAFDKANVDNYIAFHVKTGLAFEPGSQQMYSPTASFDVLVKIIEQITGTDFLTFLQREIFKPCGMENTTFIPNEKQWAQMITLHGQAEDQYITSGKPSGCVFADYPCTHFLGGAGLASTMPDYLAFARMLVNNGRVGDRQLISQDTFRLLHTPTVSDAVMPGNERWGLAVRVITSDIYRDLPVGAYGWSGAYGTHFWIDPKNKIAAVYMKNSVLDGGAGNESARNFEKAVSDALG